MAEQVRDLTEINSRLSEIELRLTKLESAFAIPAAERQSLDEIHTQLTGNALNLSGNEGEEKGLESQIGRFGLAWMGNIVLFFGIIFLTQYLMNGGQRILSAVIGLLSAGGIYYLAQYIRKSNVHMAFIFRINAQLLLFWMIMRLHFFSSAPIIAGKTPVLILLLLLIALEIYLTASYKSQAYAALSLFFALFSGMLGDSTHFTLALVSLAAIGSVFYYHKYGWKALLVTGIFFSYISFLMWMLGNPLMGHPVQLISQHHYGVVYLFVLGSCFSGLLMLRKNDGSEDDFLRGVTIGNGIFFTLALTLTVLRFFSTGYVVLFSVIAVCCLVYASVLQFRSHWNFAPAFYALYGFMSMSIALYGLFGFPRVYFLLSLQSLLVVSVGLWFRNRLIAVLNSLLFLGILLIYLLTSTSSGDVNFSFAVISLVTARIINWKKERLSIKTDLIRNLYLITGFVMVMYALYHSVPKQFISLSWTMAALIYFLLSFILRNVKYRYMALGTMICAAFYLFLVDLARIEMIYRVLALLFLAAISIGISIYYANRLKKSGT